MLASRSIRLASVLLLVAGVASCGALDDGLLQPGWQRLVITVWNNSGRPALIVVAEDQEPMGAAIGRANPNPVPAGTADVTFDFPPGRGWAIWVNPRPNTGPLIIAEDIPGDASGTAPFTIVIDGNGEPSSNFSGPTPPGWFGE